MPKRTPKELWDELVDEAGEEEIEKAASMSVAQAEAELRASGVDVDAERARARALLDELEGSGAKNASGAMARLEKSRPTGRAPSTNGGAPKERRHDGRRGAFARRWMAAGAIAAAASAALVVAKIARDSGGVTHPPPTREDLEKAADLRRRASAALAERRPTECLSLLDEAHTLDPVGDTAPEVMKLREEALRAAGTRQRGPSH